MSKKQTTSEVQWPTLWAALAMFIASIAAVSAWNCGGEPIHYQLIVSTSEK